MKIIQLQSPLWMAMVNEKHQYTWSVMCNDENVLRVLMIALQLWFSVFSYSDCWQNSGKFLILYLIQETMNITINVPTSQIESRVSFIDSAMKEKNKLYSTQNIPLLVYVIEKHFRFSIIFTCLIMDGQLGLFASTLRQNYIQSQKMASICRQS